MLVTPSASTWPSGRAVQRQLDGVEGGVDERARIDLRTGRHHPPGDRHRAVGQLRAVDGHDRRLAGRRPDVDSDQQLARAATAARWLRDPGRRLWRRLHGIPR
jgi:hypothetical protein